MTQCTASPAAATEDAYDYNPLNDLSLKSTTGGVGTTDPRVVEDVRRATIQRSEVEASGRATG
jgi:hypothetical protein